MQASDLESSLSESAAEVLETMFFTSVVGDADAAALPDEPWITARLDFRGQPSGSFRLGVSSRAARAIAVAFLGAEEEDDVRPAEVGEVICELANMICGSVLSRLESDAHFALLHPEVVDGETSALETAPEGGQTVRRSFELETGALTLVLHFEKGP